MSDSLTAAPTEEVTPEVTEAIQEVQAEVSPQVDLGEIPQWLHEYKELGPEILTEPSLKLVDSNEKLLKGYVNAQKAIGANKIVVPGKHATEDEWREVYSKLGLPENLDSYELSIKEETPDDFMQAYKEIALKNNILPQQAQALYDWYFERGRADIDAHEQNQKDMLSQEHEKLKEEWGNSYDRNIQLAQIAVRSIDDTGFMEYLDESGLAMNTQLIRAFAKLGESMYQEADIIDGDKTPLQGTRESAAKRLEEIYEDRNGPLYDSSHPAHKRVRAEVRQLHLQKNM
jgi:hypothetical protein